MEILFHIRIGRWTIRTAASLKRKIEEGYKATGKKNSIYWQCVGIYDTRICGLVFYRNGKYDF